MEDLISLAPFITALRQLSSAPESNSPAESSLDHRFHSALQEIIRLKNEEQERSTNQVIQFPVTTLALFRPKAVEHLTNSTAKRLSNAHELKICKPVPDELLQGWLGRMRAINLQKDTKAIALQIASVMRHQGITVQSEKDLVKLATFTLGTSPDILIKNHTLVPFFNALEGLRPSKLGTKSRKHREAYDRQAPLRLGTDRPRYCKQCAQEEYEEVGVSYWYRRHQLPGLLWCETHGIPLALAPNEKSFLYPPHAIRDHQIDERLDAMTDAQVSLLRRYARIAVLILQAAPTIDCLVASKILGEGARAADLRVSKPGVRTTVSTCLIKLLPSWWLQDALPRVKWETNKYISTIDAACIPRSGRFTTTTLCLLAALFFEDAEEISARILLSEEAAPSRARGFDYWASRATLDEYIAQKGVVSRVAERLGLPHSSVGVGLLNQGLPGLGKSGTAGTIKAVHAFLSGQPLSETIAWSKADSAEIEDLMRTAGYRLKIALDAIFGNITFGQLSPEQFDKRRATG